MTDFIRAEKAHVLNAQEKIKDISVETPTSQETLTKTEGNSLALIKIGDSIDVEESLTLSTYISILFRKK